jgi:hypothetical protein
MGTLTMTLVWLLLGQAPDEVLYTNQRILRIPIKFVDSRRNELRELLLFASWDQGQNYQQVATVLPDKNEFIFEARNDGTCWLKVAVINRLGKQEPDNIQQEPPNHRIIIDTMKPVVRTFTTQRVGDEVAVAWEILEDHFDVQGFRLEYQQKDHPSSFWTTVQAAPGLTGQTRFRPAGAGTLSVRLICKDLGGNQSLAYAEVPGTVTTAAYNPPVASVPPTTFVTPPPTNPPASFGAAPPPPPEVTKPNLPPPSNTWAPQGPVEAPEKLLATSQSTSHAAPPIPSNDVPAPNLSRKVLPPLRYVNHPEVVLEYELNKVGKSGVGSVDLWWSQNDGQSWELYAVDPEIKGSTQNGKHQRSVELPGDGVFGFILVVKSRAGLGKPPPRAGDVPDIRVEVDTVPPVAQLYAPSPDPQRPGNLLLKWAAKDNNLTNNPITWEWAERREGPWNPIAVDIPNTGRQSWQLPDLLPVQVYLRLKVRDLAGNESVAVTPDPQLVDLSEPEGRLLNVTAPPRRP